ncbi:MAG TPA: hypothetical protein VKV73_09235 [Chloroflexota bacterium]|nr:hypothetical protein [Chloroflexota bacterium]
MTQQLRQVLSSKALQFRGGRQRSIDRTWTVDLGQRHGGDHHGANARRADGRRGHQPLRGT